MPPESVRPDGGTARLYARASRVIESRTMTTSRPPSTSRFARSSASSATRVWFSVGSSNVEANTLALPERVDEIDQALAEVRVRDLEVEHLVREHRDEVLEVRPPPGELGIHPVHRLDPEEREVLLRVLWRPSLA